MADGAMGRDATESEGAAPGSARRGLLVRHRALVVEDAADVRLLLCETLRQSGFDATGAASGAEALELTLKLEPDLVTLDLNLPDMDGIELCRQLRTATNAYVIMVTARDDETDRLIGLEIGADDYMVKPFSPRELRARVGAMFRRPRLTDPVRAGRIGGGGAGPAAGAPVLFDGDDVLDAAAPVMRCGELSLDPESREVWLEGRRVDLTRTEFDLLAVFMSRPRRVWERDTLARLVWQTDWAGDDHVIDVHVANLRTKLGRAGRANRWIKTVRGVGYRLTVPE